VRTLTSKTFTVTPRMLPRPGRLVLKLVALDAAGNVSEPVAITLTRTAVPTHPSVLPSWAWQLDRWQSAPVASRGNRPAAPAHPAAWYGKWRAWHRRPVRVSLG